MKISRRSGFVLSFAAVLNTWGSTFAQSTPSESDLKPNPESLKRLQPYLDSPRLVGQGKYSYWGFDVYHASLWTGKNAMRPEQWQAQNLALELLYLRDFEGKDIAKRSVDEMQAQSSLPTDKARAWLKTLETLFPNVRQGQRLTGIYLSDGNAHFLFDNKSLGEIKDPELAKRFFAIWLAPQTSAQELRKNLFAEAHNKN